MGPTELETYARDLAQVIQDEIEGWLEDEETKTQELEQSEP